MAAETRSDHAMIHLVDMMEIWHGKTPTQAVREVGDRAEVLAPIQN
jgi:hypothetical protein